MRVESDDLHRVGGFFACGGTRPPLEVSAALVVLVGGGKITHAVSSYELIGTHTTWNCMALVGNAVATVQGRGAGQWSADQWTQDDVPVVHGDLTPFRTVSGCRLLQVWPSSSDIVRSRWQLQLHGPDSMMIPWHPDDVTAMDKHEALAEEVNRRLR